MFESSEHNGCQIVRFFDEVSVYNIAEFRQDFFNMLEMVCRDVIIDLKHVTYMDSAGIGVLLAAQNRVYEKSYNFAIMNVPEDIYRIIKMAELDDTFVIYSDIPGKFRPG